MNTNTMIWRRWDGSFERHTHRMPAPWSGGFYEDLRAYAGKVFAGNGDVSGVEVYCGRGRAHSGNIMAVISRGDGQ